MDCCGIRQPWKEHEPAACSPSRCSFNWLVDLLGNRGTQVGVDRGSNPEMSFVFLVCRGVNKVNHLEMQSLCLVDTLII